MSNVREPFSAHAAGRAITRARGVAAHARDGVAATRQGLAEYLAEQRKGWRLPDLNSVLRDKTEAVRDLDRVEAHLKESADPLALDFDIAALKASAKKGLATAGEAALPYVVADARAALVAEVMAIRQGARDCLAILDKIEILLADMRAVSGSKVEGPRVVAPKSLLVGLKAVAQFDPASVVTGEA